MKSKEQNEGNYAAILAAILLLAIGTLLVPTVFKTILAFDSLLPQEEHSLIISSVVVILSGGLLLLFRRLIPSNLSLILFGFGLIVLTDLAFRFIVKVSFSDELKTDLALDGFRTYPENIDYTGHPFLNFVKNTPSYNRLGFNDIDHSYLKPESVYRVACLGGSTTERGYPQLLEKLLNESSDSIQFEVLNFGMASWTSAHSMINYLLNVVEYDPDMVIIHHGWNEAQIRNAAEGTFRPDYGHAFTYFHEPERPDGLLVRISMIYRFIKHKISATEDWMYLNKAVISHDPTSTGINYSDTTELEPYRRNIKSIIDHALIAKTDVILTTMPYNSSLEETAMAGSAINIRQCNTISHQLLTQYDTRVTLVDLDSLMTGVKNDQFADLGHVTEEGKMTKASILAKAILESMATPNPILE